MEYKNLKSKSFRDSPLRLFFIALLVVGLVVGCAHIRKATYPRDFVFLDDKKVRSKMALLSLSLRQLEEVMADQSSVSSEQQQRILAILNQIDQNTSSLAAGNVVTNHRIIDDHIDEFRSDVADAIRNARADPPNYFALGRLSGSCVACHKYR